MMRGITPDWRRLAPALMFLLAAGCADKSSGPAGPSNDVPLDVNSVSQQSVATLSLVDGLVDGIDQLAAGDFSGVTGDLGAPSGAFRADPVPVWDGSGWVIDAQGTQTDANGTSTYDIHFRVAFLDDTASPQQNPDSTTTTMSMSADYLVDAHTQDQGTTFDIQLDYSLDMTVGDLQTGPYTVTGNGAMDVGMQFSGNGDSGNLALSMGWEADLVVPQGNGCPSGSASVTVENWTFDADYDGQGHYDWLLYEGNNQVGQGQESLSCVVVPAS